jgi:hypothetical protein
MLGLIAFGIGTWKTRVLPRYVGITLVLLEPASTLPGLALSPIAPLHDRGAYSGAVEKGIALAIVALGIRQVDQRTAPGKRIDTV